MYLARTLTIVAVSSLVVACGDLTGTSGTFAVVTDTLNVFAINGTPASAPTGLLLVGSLAAPEVVRIDISGGFDLAFDIDTAGRVILLPLNRVISTVLVERSVGLLRSATAFESLTTVPSDGYVTDSTITVTPNETVALAVESDWCSVDANSVVGYGKLVVDHVDVIARQIFLRIAVNPNCGVRRF